MMANIIVQSVMCIPTVPKPMLLIMWGQSILMEALFTIVLYALTLLPTRKVIKITSQGSTSKMKFFYFSGPTISDPEELVQFLQKLEDGKYICTICNSFSNDKTNARNHVEAKHFDGSFTYNCPLCPKTFSNKTSYNNHKARQHK